MAHSNSKSKRVCAHDECKLNENNNIRMWQLAYLGICFLALTCKFEEFGSLSIFLYVMPIIIDLFYLNMSKIIFLKLIKTILIVLNLFLLAVCLYIFIGGLAVNEDTFQFSHNVMFLKNLVIEKKYIVAMMFLDLSVPIIYYNAAPSKKTTRIIEANN